MQGYASRLDLAMVADDDGCYPDTSMADKWTTPPLVFHSFLAAEGPAGKVMRILMTRYVVQYCSCLPTVSHWRQWRWELEQQG